MKPFIVIREYRKTDDVACQDLIRDYIMSYVKEAFVSCIFREITLQLIVLSWALLFIFCGVPLLICCLSVPGVIALIFFVCYAVHYNKAVECGNALPKQCWVAEAFEPFSLQQLDQRNVNFDLLHSETQLNTDDIEVNKMKRSLVGTLSLKPHESLHNSAWLHRFAVNKAYPFEIIAEGLFARAIRYGLENDIYSLETSTTECQCDERELYAKLGFSIRQVYHKQIVGSSLRIMKSQLGIDLTENPRSKFYHNNK